MISPFAPLSPWLRDALGHQVVRWSAGLPRIASSDYPTPYEIDLRDLQTRTAVLRALHDVGRSCPWVLGAPWSPLTDEQAGRAAAAILRAVGEDPARPVGVVPVCVLGPWTPARPLDHSQAAAEQRPILRTLHGFHCEMLSRWSVNWSRGNPGWHVNNGWRVRLGTDSNTTGREMDEAARAAADTAARALGALLIEDLTLGQAPATSGECRTVRDLLELWFGEQEQRVETRQLAASSLGTMRAVVRALLRELGPILVGAVSIQTLERYRDARLAPRAETLVRAQGQRGRPPRRAGMAPWTVARELRVLGAAWTWGYERGLVPTATLPQPAIRVRAVEAAGLGVLPQPAPAGGELVLLETARREATERAIVEAARRGDLAEVAQLAATLDGTGTARRGRK